jgi:hypothetical protein
MFVHRKNSTNQRIEPCQFCGYPISQRHHALPFHIFGENECVLRLCANCHELYHVIEKSYLSPTTHENKLLESFVCVFGTDDVRIKKAAHFIAAAINIAKGER